MTEYAMTRRQYEAMVERVREDAAQRGFTLDIINDGGGPHGDGHNGYMLSNEDRAMTFNDIREVDDELHWWPDEYPISCGALARACIDGVMTVSAKTVRGTTIREHQFQETDRRLRANGWGLPRKYEGWSTKLRGNPRHHAHPCSRCT